MVLAIAAHCVISIDESAENCYDICESKEQMKAPKTHGIS